MVINRNNSKLVWLLYVYVIFLFLGQYQFNSLMRIIYAVLVLGVLFFNYRYLSRLDTFTVRLALLLVYALVSCLWADDTSLAFGGFISMAQCTLITISVYVLCNSENKIQKLLWCIVIAMVLFDIYIITTVGFQELAAMAQQGVRADMTVEAGINANNVGYMSALVMPLLFYLCMHNGKKIYLVLELLFGASVIFSASRTAVVMLLLGFSLYALLLQRSKKMLGIVAGIVTVLIILSILATQGYLDTIFDRFGEAQESIKVFFTQDSRIYGDGNIRLRLIKGGLVLWMHNPIWGYGLNQFGRLIQPIIGFAYAPHNTYTQALVSFGIFGLILWQGLYFIAIKKLWRNRSNLDVMLIIMVVMWLFGDLFGHSMNDKTSFILIGLCYARILSKKNTKEVIKNVTLRKNQV